MHNLSNKPSRSLFILLGLALTTFLSISAQKSKTTISLIPDPSFGAGTDWGFYFPSANDHSIGFMKDGSFYMASTKQNTILYFNKDGKLQSEFGRSGQGPGDLTYPTDVSVLDERYVVVLEYGLTQRISIFDTKGVFIKILRTNGPVSSCQALSNGKIAIVTGSLNPPVREDRVSILDIEIGKQTEVAAFSHQILGRGRLQVVSLEPKVCIARIGDDDLAVGFTDEPSITIYSHDGTRLGKISLNIAVRKVKRSEIERFLLAMAETQNKEVQESLKKVVRQNIDTIPLPEKYPYYYQMAVDSQQRIFIYANDAWIDGTPVSFQVYSRKGEFITDAIINAANYRGGVYPSNFFKDSFYALLTTNSTSGDIYLAKIPIQYQLQHIKTDNLAR